MILTGDVSEFGGFRLFRSRDFGLTFEPTDLPFVPLIQMLYNPGDSNTLLTLSITVAALCLPRMLSFSGAKLDLPDSVAYSFFRSQSFYS